MHVAVKDVGADARVNVGENMSADTAWRLQWYPRLLLAAMAGAFLFVALTADGSSTTTGRLGGDYPAFHGAGSIVLDGNLDSLYDPAAQAAAQEDLLGGEDGFLPFVYPPHVGAAYAPLAALPYNIAYVLHTLLMAGATLLAVHLIRPMVPAVDRWYWVSAAAALSVYPMFRAIGGGQNTALTLLALAAVWRALAEDREVVAGIAAGLLLFRPQYAVPLIGLLWLARHHRAVASAAAVGAATWLANAALLGSGWLGSWLGQVGPFVETDADVNGASAISLLGFLESIVGAGHWFALSAGAALAGASAMLLAALWWRHQAVALPTRMAATAAGLVLMSPHALFYDAGVLLITAAVALDRGWIDARGLAAVWLLAITDVTKSSLGFTPLALLVMGGFAAVLVCAAPLDQMKVGRRSLAVRG